MQPELAIVLTHALTPHWAEAPVVRMGCGTETTCAPPDLYALVSQGDGPVLRIELHGHPGEARAFEAAILWAGFAALGYGEHLYLVDLALHNVFEFNLEDYFGHLHAGDDQLLVASAQRIFAIGPDGRLLWRSTELGIDGVVIHEVGPNEIRGSGEWDPPGGWETFRLATQTGHLLEGGKPPCRLVS